MTSATIIFMGELPFCKFILVGIYNIWLLESNMTSETQLSSEIQSIINEEVSIFETVMTSLHEQQEKLRSRLHISAQNVAELEDDIASLTRDEDKMQFTSNESVGKTLNKKYRKDLVTINKIIKNPYFARIVVEEKLPSGQTKQIEYKMGQHSNPDCSIVDWKHAPLAKLYYEYQQGEEYFEEIQGRERNGIVVLRNKLEVKNGKLIKITCRYGTFVQQDGTWQEYSRKIGENGASPNGLPNILSLITSEQFKLITEDANSAVLIDGIAGSGKTTVALHRLAWLMEKGNKGVEAKNSLVFVHNKIIKAYINDYLPSLGAENPQITTFTEWKEVKLKEIVFKNKNYVVKRPEGKLPPGVRRVKSSMAMLKAIDDFMEYKKQKQFDFFQRQEGVPFRDEILEILENYERILQYDDTKLLSKEVIKDVLEYTRKNFEQGILDYFDDSIMLRLSQLINPTANNYYQHIIVDEVQDYSALNLAIIISSVKNTSDLTLVGDIQQQSRTEDSFPGWDSLMEYWKFSPADSSYAKLSVSHRSTLQIMKLADHISGNPRTTSGRKGDKPLWMHCMGENDGIEQLIRWLETNLEKYPTSIIAVVCHTTSEAHYAESLLSPTFGSVVRLFSDNVFSFEEGIIVTTAGNIKGLEFPIVCLWNPSKKQYPPTKNAQNALYIAITRAQDILSIFSWGLPCTFLPSISSKLVYGVDRRELIDEPENKPLDFIG